jgi:hypothetical protein
MRWFVSSQSRIYRGFGLQFQNPVLESRLFYEIRNYFIGDAGDDVGAPGLQTLHTRE